jgi:hypothetical protein
MAGAAAVAASVGMSALLGGAGLAYAAPGDQSSGQGCQPAPGGPGGQQGGGPQHNGPQGPQNNGPQGPQHNAPQQGHEGNAPQNPQGNPQNPQSNPQNPHGNPAPSNQPKPPPYVPSGHFDRGNAQVGGPTDSPHGFSTLGNGAPPAPPQRGLGWNDGPAPGGPPPNWDGPPPAGGWNGPPPPGGWNRRYDGPPRDVVRARDDFGPFNYHGFTALPVFNPLFGGWGYWYFGVWIPLF